MNDLDAKSKDQKTVESKSRKVKNTDNTVEKQWEFKKGQSGNPNGRPKGSRNKLSERFLQALAADFERYGIYSIARVRRKDPTAYLKIITSVLPKEINGNLKHDHSHQHTHESISETAKWLEGLFADDDEPVISEATH